MANLVPLNEAAKMLGVSVEQLNEMRKSNEIFGYRDGNNWKFKLDEIQRVAEAKGISLGGEEDLEFELSDSSSIEDVLADSDSADVIGEDEELSFGSSDIQLAAESSGNVLSDDEGAKKDSPSDTGKMGSDSLKLAEEDLFEDEINISDSAESVEASDLSSDFEDSDLVLDDSDSSSEVAMDTGETGVSLSPTDSGISLEEEPLELGGSDIDSLELPEDDDIIALEDAADSDSATELKMSDDDFNLTPLEDQFDDSSSGSQVIALEDSSIYTDESAPTLLSESDDSSLQPLVPADSAEMQNLQPGGAVAVSRVETLPEADYSIWNVLSLVLVLVTVGLGTIVAFNLAQNMWQPEGTQLSNSVMNFFIWLSGATPD